VFDSFQSIPGRSDHLDPVQGEKIAQPLQKEGVVIG
jgi:hypothetical protein